jgi:hypothetical protein
MTTCLGLLFGDLHSSPARRNAAGRFFLPRRANEYMVTACIILMKKIILIAVSSDLAKIVKKW